MASYKYAFKNISDYHFSPFLEFVNSTSRTKAPWMLSIQKFDEDIENNFFNEQLSDDGDQWTYPYFICDKNSWIISFVQTISNKNGR